MASKEAAHSAHSLRAMAVLNKASSVECLCCASSLQAPHAHTRVSTRKSVTADYDSFSVRKGMKLFAEAWKTHQVLSSVSVAPSWCCSVRT